MAPDPETRDQLLALEKENRDLRDRLARLEREATSFEVIENAILEAAPDAMIIVDAAGRMMIVNSQTERLFGYSRAELVGKQVEMLVPRRYVDHRAHREEYGKRPGVRPMGAGLQLFGLRKDGSEFPVEISLSPLRTKDGQFVISAIRDASERRMVEKRIQSLNAELEERVAERTAALQRTNEELQRFSYVAAHDLKEPLRTVISYTQLLARRYKGILGSDADEFIHFAVDGAQRMNVLIDALLRYSRLDDPAQAPAFEPIDMDEMVRLVMKNLAAAIRESSATINAAALPTVRGDSAQLIQLWQNLIDNAIKYRSREAPLIEIGAEQSGGTWVFRVKDNGIGIDPQFVDRVFQPFKRLHGSEYPGAGIGLAICKRIVEHHKGRIWVESAPGAGSTFSFALPA